MATIDLIVLGMLTREPMSAYDIQKQVEYRQVSRWVKVSTPSIYKKVLQLEEKGYIVSRTVKEGKMPEKAVYTLTESGRKQFEALMLEVANAPIQIFLDFNAVIVNLDSLEKEKQAVCLDGIEKNVKLLKGYIEENIRKKESLPGIPDTAKAVLRQQEALTEAIEAWLASLKEQRI